MRDMKAANPGSWQVAYTNDICHDAEERFESGSGLSIGRRPTMEFESQAPPLT